MPSIECVGGPHDGLTRNRRSTPSWLWVDGAGRCFSRAAEGRILYERADSIRRNGPLVYVHRVKPTLGLCTGCGAEVRRTDLGARACPLCGGALQLP